MDVCGVAQGSGAGTLCRGVPRQRRRRPHPADALRRRSEGARRRLARPSQAAAGSDRCAAGAGRWDGTASRGGFPGDAATRGRAAAADRAVLRPGRLDRAVGAGSTPKTWAQVIRAYQDAAPRLVERWEGHRRQVHGRWRARLFRLAAGARGRGRAGGAGGARDRRGGGGAGGAGGAPLAARVGIATGLVMVGELIGEGAAQEQTVVGETPNLAARLQALAEPGQRGDQPGDPPAGRRAVRADRSRPATAEGLRRASHGLAGRGRRSRRRPLRGAAMAQHLTPLVGREHELGILLRALDLGQGRRRPGGAARRASPGSASRAWCGRCASALAGEPHIRRSATSARPITPTARCYPVIEPAGAGGAASSATTRRRTQLAKLEALLARGDAAGWTRWCRCSRRCSACRPGSAIRP